MGDLITSTCTGLKAGPGRLVLADVLTAAGEFVTSSFTVHVADGKLMLAFSGVAPRINALEITSAPQAATLYIVGDSTVTDQPQDGYPYTGWGKCCRFLLKRMQL